MPLKMSSGKFRGFYEFLKRGPNLAGKSDQKVLKMTQKGKKKCKFALDLKNRVFFSIKKGVFPLELTLIRNLS